MVHEDKFDIDASTVTLDLDQLVETAKIAVGLAGRNLDDRLEAWDSGKPVSVFDAEWMLSAAGLLAQATRSHHYLSYVENREFVKIAGKKTLKSRGYNKITLIKILREMLTDRGYTPNGILPTLKDCKDIVERLFDELEMY